MKMEEYGKKITILFPTAGNKPVGGFKVVLQYANLFSKRGYDVHIIYSCFHPLKIAILHSVFRALKYSIDYLYRFLFNKYSCRNWFELAQNVQEHYVWSLSTSEIPESDYYLATAAITAEPLLRFSVSPQQKLYLIQGYEPWQIGEENLFNTYRIQCKKIVVSQWLKRIVSRYSDCYYVPNGFDDRDFRLTKPIENRNPFFVSIMYHEYSEKRFFVGYNALCRVKRAVPQLKVLVFGVYDRPSFLPSWFQYYKSPNKEEHNWINNEASIFLGTSRTEGYGLTIGEAMMCGQAVVCTNNDGYLEMAVPNENALVCPVDDDEALALSIIKLINDNDLRITIARRGYLTIQEFTIEKSFEKLMEILDKQEL